MAAGGIYEPVCRRTEAPAHPNTADLIAAAKRLAAQGLTPSYGPGDHGNLSCRTAEDCLITARETRKASLREGDLAHVGGCERRGEGVRLFYEGSALPSTDAVMHWGIYAARPDITAIVHGHDEQVLAKAEGLWAPITRVSAASNSLELVEEVLTLAALHDYLILRDHGFLALGRSLQAAEACYRQWSQRARAVR